MSTAPHDIRQHILDTGEALILGRGFTAVGLAELLSTARVPKGSFYHYFASKEQFGEALLDSYFTRYLLRLDGLLRADGSPARDRLNRYWALWLEVQGCGPCAEQCMVVKLSAEVSDLSEAMRLALLNGTDQVLRRLAQCLDEGIQDRSLAAGLDPQATAHALYQLWLGASLLTKVRREPSALRIAQDTTERLLSGTP